MSTTHKQGFIEAPVERIWDLVSDIERHPLWWPRVVEVECEGLAEEGCTYREVVETPFGNSEMHMVIDGFEDCRNLSIRCLNTGTFVRFGLTEAQEGTFLDCEMGMDPKGLGSRAFDAIAGRRYFRSWLAQTFEALRRASVGSRAAG